MTLAEAFKSAGVDTDAARLHGVAVKALQKSKLNPFMAVERALPTILKDAGLIAALVGRDEIARLAREYLQARAAEMATPPGEGGQEARDTHLTAAPSPNPFDGGVAEGATVPDAAAPASVETQAQEAGHRGRDAHEVVARPPARSHTHTPEHNAGREWAEDGKLKPKFPTPSQVAATIETWRRAAENVLSRHVMPNGKPWAECTLVDMEAIREGCERRISDSKDRISRDKKHIALAIWSARRMTELGVDVAGDLPVSEAEMIYAQTVETVNE